jgi:hypothetical protein
LVNGGECAYVIFDEKGITKCGIEKAYEDGVIDWQKPISCHSILSELQNTELFWLITTNGVYVVMLVH